MKKRSLVAALAMLVVSAIVLTSSTYAWFATSSAATVQSISATVSNNDGSLTVAATGVNAANTTKKTNLTEADFKDLTSTLIPVTAYIGESGFTANTVAYDAAKFTSFAGANPNAEYLTYQFNVEYIAGAEAGATVQITPSFSTDSQFCYGILGFTVGETTNYYIYNAAGSYEPLKSLTNEVIDNGNSIVDSGDTGFSEGDVVAVGATSATNATALDLMTVGANTTGIATVSVYVWAEGQDPQCVGNVSSASSYFTFDLAAV